MSLVTRDGDTARESDLAGEGARALIIATATHHDSQLPSVPAAERTARALADRLIEVCGMPAERVRLLVDPASSREIAQAVTEEAALATATLLVHYVGHGLRGPGGGLYLAASSTDQLTPGLAGHQAYPYLELRQALASASAGALVVVLDCCFSGRAPAGAPALDGIFDSPPVHGFYLLGSAEQLALAPEDAAYTTFTGELIELLDRGDPRGGPSLTLDDAYDHLFQAMRTRGAPVPRRQEGGRTGQMILAPNAAFVPSEDSTHTAEEQSPGRSPYPGLAPFTEQDARVFHGRARAADELFEAVRRQLAEEGLLLVVGASGSGKSSLVQAGLLPRVRSLGWRCTSITPGERPLERLATAVGAAEGSAAADALVDPAGASEWLPEDGRPLLVVVDQLEEMFTLCPSEDERAAFAGALAALGGVGRAVVLGAVRADFYAQVTGHPELAEALRSRQFLVEPMAQEQLRAAIEEPARVGGLHLDDALPDLILTELGATRRQGAEPGALPLMSHALWTTWRRRRGNRLTVRDYREAGGIGGTIAKSADDLLESLDQPARDAVRLMLPRLVRVGEDTVDTALRLDRAGLTRGLPADAAARALQALTEARLVTADQDVVRISHEVLLTSWPRLREWIDEDRRWLGTVQRLAADARSWLAADRTDASLLYRGARLNDVLEQTAHAGELDEDSAAFLSASVGQERRSSRLRRLAVAGLVVLLAASLVGGGVAMLQARQNAQQARAADARSLISTADALRATDPHLAMQLGVAAHRLTPTTASSTALVETLTRSRYTGVLPERSSPVSALAVSPDSTRLATGTRQGVSLWAFGDPGRSRRLALKEGFDDAVTTLAWHPKGELLVAGDAKKLHLLRVKSDGQLDEVGTLPGFATPVLSTSWSADGQVLVVSDETTVVIIVADTDGYQVAATIDQKSTLGHVRSLLTRDGKTMVAGTEQGDVQLWDLSDPRSPRKRGAPLSHDEAKTAPIKSFALSSDDRLLAGGAQDGKVVLWDLNALPSPRLMAPAKPAGLSMPVTHLAFDSTDSALVAADQRGAVAIMRFSGEIGLRTLPDPEPAFATHTGALGDMVLDTRQGLIVTGGDDGAIRLWQLHDGGIRPRRAGSPVPGHENFTGSGRISAAGDVAASTAEDGKLLVWSVDGKGAFTPRPAVTYGAESSDRNPSGSALTRDGRTVATAADIGGKPGVRLWDVSGSGPPVRLGDTQTTSSPRAFAWSGDGSVLVSGAVDGTVTVHGVSDRKLAQEALSQFTVEGSVTAVHLSEDSSVLAVATQSGVVELRDLRDPHQPRKLGTVPTGQFGNKRSDTALSADGKLLAIGQFSGGVRLWSLANPQAPEQLTSWQVPGVGIVAALAFSPDSRLLAIGTLGSARLWDISDQRLPRQIGVPLILHDLLPLGLAFVPGRDVLASQGTSSVDLWDLSMLPMLRDDGARVACERLGGQGLSQADWARFLPGQEYQNTCPA